MKLTDVVQQLQLVLPKYTDYFDEELTIDSISVTPTVATIVTVGDHELSVNDNSVTISNVSVQSPITGISQDGLVFTITTENKHDLTYGYPGYETVTLGGFTDDDWNDSFNLVAVTDRYTFKIQSVNTLPTLNGNEYLTEIRIDGVNGRHQVTIINDTTFTISGTFNSGTYLGGTIKRSVRIAGSIEIERTLDQYTKQNINDLWAFVSMNAAISSKDRNAYSDGVATFVNGEDVRLRMIDGFSVFLVKNVTQDIAAVEALDIMRHDLFNPILKSLYGTRFSTGLGTEGDFKSIITSHNQVFYNRAILVYQYNFQMAFDITLENQVIDTDTRAFSEIDYKHSIGGDDTTDLIANFELPA